MQGLARCSVRARMRWLALASLLVLVACTESTADSDDDDQDGPSSGSAAGGTGGTASGGAGGGDGGAGGNAGGSAADFSAAYYVEVNDTFTSWKPLITERDGQTTELDLGVDFALGRESSLAVSPDGTQLAAVGTDEITGDVVLRLFPMGTDHLPQANATTDLTTLNPTHEEASIGTMTFSHGGSYIVLRTDYPSADDDWRLFVMPTGGGSLMPIFDGEKVSDAYFASDDHLLVSHDGECHLATAPNFVPEVLHLDCYDAVFDGQGRLYFRSRVDAFGGNEIRRATNGVVEPEPVPGTTILNNFGDPKVDGFVLSPQGDRLAFTAEDEKRSRPALRRRREHRHAYQPDERHVPKLGSTGCVLARRHRSHHLRPQRLAVDSRRGRRPDRTCSRQLHLRQRAHGRRHAVVPRQGLALRREGRLSNA